MCKIRITPDETRAAADELHKIVQSYEQLDVRLNSVLENLSETWSSNTFSGIVEQIIKTKNRPVLKLAKL